MTGWFEETLHPDWHSRLKIDRLLYENDTDHQRLTLFENGSFGRVLTLDGVVQTTEGDEFVYHEMLAHVPVLAHGTAKSVLVIGGGDGGMLREVLKHRGVQSATLVEIDAGVITFSRQYLPKICGDAFDDPRTEVVIADGADFVTSTERRFDVVIVDSTDPIGPGEALFTERFYQGCKRCLAAGGVLVTQNGVPFVQAEELSRSVSMWRPLFADAGCYLAAVPLYIGGFMALGWATDDPALRAVPLETLEQRFAAAAIVTDYYTPAVHKAAFALPPYIERLIG